MSPGPLRFYHLGVHLLWPPARWSLCLFGAQISPYHLEFSLQQSWVIKNLLILFLCSVFQCKRRIREGHWWGLGWYKIHLVLLECIFPCHMDLWGQDLQADILPHLAFSSYMADVRGHFYLVPRTWQCQQKHTAGIHCWAKEAIVLVAGKKDLLFRWRNIGQAGWWGSES